jgi:phage FluMu protein gp41
MKFNLKHGLTVGIDKDKVTHTEIEISKVTTKLLQQAKEAAEKVVPTPTGYELLISPTIMENEILRRRIVRIGDIQGPLQIKEFYSLHEDDIDLIVKNMQEFDKAEDLDSSGRLDTKPA